MHQLHYDDLLYLRGCMMNLLVRAALGTLGIVMIVGTALVACSSDSSSSSSSSSSSGSAGPLKCTLDSEKCDCDTKTADFKEIACNPIAVGGGASICCAEPAFAQSKQGACSCTNFSCALLANVDCRCGQSYLNAGATRVQKCDPPVGKKCCLSQKKDECSCPVSTSGTSTPCAGTEVDHCGVDIISRTCAPHFAEGFQAPVATCRD
jgi:hypothetical protein